ncbi:uncharacterized protein LOC130294270 [Hyla sarda]|uniref:uncharacterized protein LOC130294270 n=1 Tax=Hyla sarda TaxID=327740 RepID=UPI0024C35469|nr:uncharacterized protein LOC130294270 [Hyla sarda]
MKVVQRLLCLLAPLIVTARALTCTSCVCLNEVTPTCTNSSAVQCSPSEVCATTYRKTTSQNGKVTYDIIRACAPKDKCDKVGGLSSYNVRMTMGIGCCSTDRCAPNLPQLTQDTSAYNDVQCSTCSSSQSTICQTIGNMTCTGQETRCVTYSMSGTGHALMCTSCVSLNACELNCTSDSTVQCSSSELCATAYRKKSHNGKITYDIIRACAPKDKCDKVGGLSSSNVKMTMGIGCCSTDRCAPVLPQCE